MSLVKDFMIEDFELLRGDLSLQKAIAQLADSRYAVVENTNQQAIGVVTVDEIEVAIVANKITLVLDTLISSWLLKVGSKLEMQAVADSPLLKTLVQEAQVALVVDDSNSIIGLLTADAIRQFIWSGASQQKGTVLGNDSNSYISVTQLAGAYSPLTAYCICLECWYVNELFADQWAVLKAISPKPTLTCQNPDPDVFQHLLKLS